MPHYKIADIVCEFIPGYEETAHWYKPYETDEPLDFEKELVVSESRVDYLVREGVNITPAIAENMVLTGLFNEMLLKHFNGCYVHSSALLYDGKVYLFSGNSGVGKSTHTRMWCERFPDKAMVINDDKPSYRIIDDKCIVYGTPFAGGTGMQKNACGELGAIVFMEQSDENTIELLPTSKAVNLLLEQSINIQTEKSLDKLLSLCTHILSNYPIYKLRCTDSEDAVDVAMKIINN